MLEPFAGGAMDRLALGGAIAPPCFGFVPTSEFWFASCAGNRSAVEGFEERGDAPRIASMRNVLS